MRYTEKYNRLHTEWDKASTELNKLGDFVLKLEGEMEKEMETQKAKKKMICPTCKKEMELKNLPKGLYWVCLECDKEELDGHK